MSQRIALSDHKIEILKYDGSRYQVLDTVAPGLVLRVGARSKAFYFHREYQGKKYRRKLGVYPGYSLQNARSQTRAYSDAFDCGENPFEQEQAAPHTMADLYPEFLAAYEERKGFPYSASTLDSYNRFINHHFVDWATLPAATLLDDDFEDAILDRYRQIKSGSWPDPDRFKGGWRMADLAFAFWSALTEYAITEKKRLGLKRPINPCVILARKKLHQPKTRRRTVINTRIHLGAFWRACEWIALNARGRRERIAADAALTMVLLSTRKTETLAIQTDWLDMETLIINWPAKEKKSRQDHGLPITPEMEKIIRRRLADNPSSPFLFPGTGKTGHLTTIRGTLQTVCKAIGSEYRGHHDVRRTMDTFADELGLSASVRKHIKSHAPDQSDVTDGYLSADPERLRPHLELVEQEILKRAAAAPLHKPGRPVIKFPDDETLERLLQRYPIKEIAVALGIDHWRVTREADTRNIPRPAAGYWQTAEGKAVRAKYCDVPIT